MIICHAINLEVYDVRSDSKFKNTNKPSADSENYIEDEFEDDIYTESLPDQIKNIDPEEPPESMLETDSY